MITDRHVQRLAQKGIIPKAERGQYDLVKSVQGYIRHLQKTASTPADERDPIGRIQRAKATLAELDVNERKGELVKAEEVQQEWETLIGRARSRFLAMPTKLAVSLTGLSSPSVIQERIEREVHEALDELAAGEEDTDSGGEALEEPAETDDQPVG